jgi:hypothetical protein
MFIHLSKHLSVCKYFGMLQVCASKEYIDMKNGDDIFDGLAASLQEAGVVS